MGIYNGEKKRKMKSKNVKSLNGDYPIHKRGFLWKFQMINIFQNNSKFFNLNINQ